MKNDNLFSKKDNWLFEILLQNLFSKDILKKADLELPRKELLDKVFAFISKNGFPVTIDHRDDITSQVDIFILSKKYEYAKVFYAMYFEHTLNGLIDNACHRRKFDDRTRLDIIRSVDIYGKLTWLPRLLGHKVFNSTHVKTIKNLADERNAFVHYKWNIEHDNDAETVNEKKQEDYFKKIKAAVSYMKRYEAEIMFGGSKAKIKKALK
jgi:hypothetical protein